MNEFCSEFCLRQTFTSKNGFLETFGNVTYASMGGGWVCCSNERVNTVDFWNVLCTAAYCADAKVRVTVELLPLFFNEDEKLLIGQQTCMLFCSFFVTPVAAVYG